MYQAKKTIQVAAPPACAVLLFFFLQETNSDEKCISSWEAEWGGKVSAAHGSKYSKGVMFLINPKF